MYSVIVSFGVIVSFRFSVFIVKGIFGVDATDGQRPRVYVISPL